MSLHRFSFQNANIGHYELGASTVGNCETKVLILEDDPLAASELKDCLAREGFHPSIACSKEHFEKIVEQHEFQLLIVDIGLPDGSGLDVIREVREQSSVGIIVVSAYTTESDVVAAIELGADDYIKKPISIKELRAKVRRMMIRTSGSGYSSSIAQPNNNEQKFFGDWHLDLDSHRLFYRINHEVGLTSAEYKILLALLNNCDQILSRHSLLNHLQSISSPYDERTIDGLINRVRKKLAIPASYEPVQKVRNAGYMFCETVRTEHQQTTESPNSGFSLTAEKMTIDTAPSPTLEPPVFSSVPESGSTKLTH